MKKKWLLLTLLIYSATSFSMEVSVPESRPSTSCTIQSSQSTISSALKPPEMSYGWPTPMDSFIERIPSPVRNGAALALCAVVALIVFYYPGSPA